MGQIEIDVVLVIVGDGFRTARCPAERLGDSLPPPSSQKAQDAGAEQEQARGLGNGGGVRI
jgi:hypothetical protein